MSIGGAIMGVHAGITASAISLTASLKAPVIKSECLEGSVVIDHSLSVDGLTYLGGPLSLVDATISSTNVFRVVNGIDSGPLIVAESASLQSVDVGNDARIAGAVSIGSDVVMNCGLGVREQVSVGSDLVVSGSGIVRSALSASSVSVPLVQVSSIVAATTIWINSDAIVSGSISTGGPVCIGRGVMSVSDSLMISENVRVGRDACIDGSLSVSSNMCMTNVCLSEV